MGSGRLSWGMASIQLETFIEAPAGRVFDLARSIDAHMASSSQSGERAVAGVTSGLIGLGDEVTWEARHFGIRQRLCVRVTDFERPQMFADEMVSGAFESMRHVHRFVEVDGGTRMVDEFSFRAPLGPLGRIAEWAILTRYMRRFLVERNRILKETAESDAWSAYLPAGSGL